MNKQDIPPEKKALMHDLEQKVIIRTALVWQKGGGGYEVFYSTSILEFIDRLSLKHFFYFLNNYIVFQSPKPADESLAKCILHF